MPSAKPFTSTILAASVATLLCAAPAQAQSAGQTPTQPTANDPSPGLPSQAATTTTNPVAMDPQAARKEGTAPAVSDKADTGK